MSDWSAAEKKIARRAYEAARKVVLAKTLVAFKAKAAAAATVDDMWEVRDYLRQQGRELDALLDYRYSILTIVFGRLIEEGHLHADQLAGLSQDKLDEIQRWISRRAQGDGAGGN
jgi:Photoprotection regulator fluorescence recovery protein